MKTFKKKNPKEKLIFIATILIVLALGLFSINQFLAYRYKSELLQKPCQLCASLNPNQTKCIEGCFVYDAALYPDKDGQWRDMYGNCYDHNNRPIQCPKLKIDLNNLTYHPDR